MCVNQILVTIAVGTLVSTFVGFLGAPGWVCFLVGVIVGIVGLSL